MNIIDRLNWLGLNVLTNKTIDRQLVESFLDRGIKFDRETELYLEKLCDLYKEILADSILKIKSINRQIIKQRKYTVNKHLINIIIPPNHQQSLLNINFLRINIHELGPKTYTASLPVLDDYHWNMISAQDIEETYQIRFLIDGHRLIYYD